MIYEKYEQMYYLGESLWKIYLTAALDFSLIAIIIFGSLLACAYIVYRLSKSQKTANVNKEVKRK